MSTIINITKEVIESQNLNNGFSIEIFADGGFYIKPENGKKPREGWSEILEKYKDEINNDEDLKIWLDADPYLVSKKNDEWV